MKREEIRELRTRLGWTQARLARELGTDAVTVSRWERGVSKPRPSAAKRLSALGLASGPKSRVRFSEDPASRLQKLDRARLEQLSLKRRARRLA
jgi:transcriptional regulator with XRE-family HTH domain